MPHSYDENAKVCYFNFTIKGYLLFLMFTYVFLPSIIIFYCYIRIFSHANKIKKKIKDKGNLNKGNDESFKLAKTLFLSYSIYIICW